MHDEEFITLTGAIAGVFAGIRLHWGPFVEKYTYKRVYGTILAIQIILGFSFPDFGSQYKGTFLIYVSTIFFCEGAHFTLMPIMISRLFGEQATMVYAFGFSFSGVSSLITSLLVVFVFTDNFEACYYLGAALCVVALLLLMFVFRDEKFV